MNPAEVQSDDTDVAAALAKETDTETDDAPIAAAAAMGAGATIAELPTDPNTKKTLLTTINGAGGTSYWTCEMRTVSPSEPPFCRYHMRGTCRYGDHCRYTHSPNVTMVLRSQQQAVVAVGASSSSAVANETPLISAETVMRTGIRVDAPPFVPSAQRGGTANDNGSGSALDMQSLFNSLSYAQVAGTVNATNGSQNGVLVDKYTVCPFVGPCERGASCTYNIHLQLCDMCGEYCLNPIDEPQRRKHMQDCLRQHEINMELSFAVARSKDKKCGICFDTVVEKTGHEKRFGILPNCNHTYCLECIRKWRQAPQFEHKITRSCPECRVCSDFVCPSAFWVDTKEQKDKLLNDYRAALNAKDCKYFKKGEGKCPFGNKCFYKHANRNGELIDVGNPKRRQRRMRRSSDEVIDLLDLLIWDFVDQRDHQWVDMYDGSDDDTDADEDSSMNASD